MRKIYPSVLPFLAIFCALLLPLSAAAQETTSAIRGKVVNNQGEAAVDPQLPIVRSRFKRGIDTTGLLNFAMVVVGVNTAHNATISPGSRPTNSWG